MNGETTQDLSPRLSEAYRFVVRYLGARRGQYIGGGPLRPQHTSEYGTEVVDTWTGDVMTVHWAASAQLASLVAETQCAERNAPAVALTFASKLAIYMDRAREEAAEDDHSEGDVLEDVELILEWHIGHLRGLTREPLDLHRMRIPAPEFNR